MFIFAAFNLFYNLGKPPICSWDEARHGVNAYEMVKRNNFVVNTYSYKNDYWNLKPPVSYWAIALGYKLIGYNALGLRIFSAIAALITVVTVALFTLYRFGRLASLISTSVITTTTPFIVAHCGRNGDADSLFVMFFTLAIVCVMLVEKSIRWLYASGICFALAFLTKSWHAGNIAIILGLYLLLSGTLLKLKIKDMVLFVLYIVLPILLWGLLRYRHDGLTFFKTMISFDLLARTSTALEGHVGEISYYIHVLQYAYFLWLLVLVSTLLAATLLLGPDEESKRVIRYILPLILWIAIPFLLYTKAKTKIAWYIIPIYPAMAIILGWTSSLLLKFRNRNLVLQALLSIMILLAFCKNEVSIIKVIMHPGIDYTQLAIREVNKLPQYKSKNIYTTFKSMSADNPDRWEQSYLLCGELYADLIPLEGGVQGFLDDNTDRPLLLIPKQEWSVEMKERNRLKVVIENERVFILSK